MWCDCPQCSWEYQPDEREEDAAEEREAQAAEAAAEKQLERYEKEVYGE